MFAKVRSLLTDEKSDRIGFVASDSRAIASLSHALKKGDRPFIHPRPSWNGRPACATPSF
ncbi:MULTISPECIES: hypothetical protein [unclassified Microcoleus]|uniref:hypothetical protein n=1 Tax=unclassified Microcoleus TaxID=2642155 RepID=UPI002FCF70F0